MSEELMQQDTLMEALHQGLDLTGKHIGPLDLSRQVITIPLNFAGCIFEEDVSFVGTDFRRGVAFTAAEFKKKADFKEAQIYSFLPPTLPAISFSGAVFQTKALFDNAEFHHEADLTDVQFLAGAYFKNCTFHRSVTFNQARFHKAAYFWRAHFIGTAHFEGIIVYPDQSRDSGQTNFSYAYFEQEAKFDRSSLGGRCWFHRPIFRQVASFCNTVFSDTTRFYGEMSQFCIPKRDFRGRDAQDDEMIQRWRNLDILDTCLDDPSFVIINFSQLHAIRKSLGGTAASGVVGDEVVWTVEIVNTRRSSMNFTFSPLSPTSR